MRKPGWKRPKHAPAACPTCTTSCFLTHSMPPKLGASCALSHLSVFAYAVIQVWHSLLPAVHSRAPIHAECSYNTFFGSFLWLYQTWSVYTPLELILQYHAGLFMYLSALLECELWKTSPAKFLKYDRYKINFFERNIINAPFLLIPKICVSNSNSWSSIHHLKKNQKRFHIALNLKTVFKKPLRHLWVITPLSQRNRRREKTITIILKMSYTKVCVSFPEDNQNVAEKGGGCGMSA